VFSGWYNHSMDGVSSRGPWRGKRKVGEYGSGRSGDGESGRMREFTRASVCGNGNHSDCGLPTRASWALVKRDMFRKGWENWMPHEGETHQVL
jgi:hypothetical protein